jgi:TPP-dependent pyruvate/acetoin dehydrogenase alpha subunit
MCNSPRGIENIYIGEEKLYLEFYIQMYRIRRVEETLLDLFSKGLLTGTTHTCIGQEACAVGVINAIDKEKDIIFSNHRGHGHYIAYSEDLVGLFGELMGKAVGVCGGIGGSQHLCKRNFYTNGIQGGIVPVATGMALAEKLKGSGAIVVTFLGDGTLGQGVVYEAFNISALWKLPILFVLEDNEYAQTTPSYMQHAGDIAKRASVFTIESAELEVNDIIEVFKLAQKAVDYVRNEIKPFFLVLHTYRLSPHSKGDDVRPKEEIEYYKKRDPLLLLKNRLLQSGVDIQEKEEKVEKEIKEALEIVLKSASLQWEEFVKIVKGGGKD